MPWVRIEDDYFANRKIATLSKDAKLLDLAGIAYSARELRDGHLTPTDISIVATWAGVKHWPATVAALVRANRWESDGGGGYAIHDYLEYQPSREQVLAEREAARVRKATARAKRNGSPAGRHPDIAPDSGRSPEPPVPGPGPGLPSGKTESPPNPPRRPRGARQRDRQLSAQDEADLVAMQSQSVLVGGAP